MDYFHGTTATLATGASILPGSKVGHTTHRYSQLDAWRAEFVWVATDKDRAEYWAEWGLYRHTATGQPHVYKVAPIHVRHAPDTDDAWICDSATVLAEVTGAEAMGM